MNGAIHLEHVGVPTTAETFDEFPALAERLTGVGIAIDEPFINDVGDQISFFNDPAGNRAQIVGRLKPLPSRDA